MSDVQIDKAENGYIFRHRGKTYVAESFGDVMYKCALAFDEKEVIAMRNAEEEMPSTDSDKSAEIIRAHNFKTRRPGRPRKGEEKQNEAS